MRAGWADAIRPYRADWALRLGMMGEALFKQDPLRRFSGRAGEYAKYRPNYPEEAIDAILEGFGGHERSSVVADVGAGTGISARQLAGRGLRVFAIEPNPVMRAAAEAHEGVEFREGTAEATGLDNDSVELVTCFQSFHWFDPQPAFGEFHRILKPGGRLALAWNDRDLFEPTTMIYNEIVDVASNRVAVEKGRDEVGELPSSPLFTAFELQVFSQRQSLDREGLIGRARSSSQIPLEGPVHERMVGALVELWEEEKDERGMVPLTYKTKVFLAVARDDI